MGRQPGGRGQPTLEDLGGVGLQQQVAGARSQLEADLSGLRALIEPIRRRGGPDERLPSLAQDLLELGCGTKAHLSPVGQLVPDVVQLAPCQLDGQGIRSGSLGQGGRPHDRSAVPFDRPGNEQAATFRRVAMTGHQSISELDSNLSRRPIKAGDISLAIIGRPLSRVVRGKSKLHNPHGTLSEIRDEPVDRDE